MLTRGLHWSIAYPIQALIACIVMPLCASVAEMLVYPRFMNTSPSQGPYFWGPVLFGLAGGALLGRSERPVLLLLLWVVPAIRFCNVVATHLRSSPKATIAMRYVYDNYIGKDCGGTECLGQVFVTIPLVSAISYSFGALLTRWIVNTNSSVSLAR